MLLALSRTVKIKNNSSMREVIHTGSQKHCHRKSMQEIDKALGVWVSDSNYEMHRLIKQTYGELLEKKGKVSVSQIPNK